MEIRESCSYGEAKQGQDKGQVWEDFSCGPESSIEQEMDGRVSSVVV